MIKQITVSLACLLATLPQLLAAQSDTRQFVDLPVMMRSHMLTNMRDHLLAVTQIQQALAESEFDRAAEIAEARLGMSSTTQHGAAQMSRHMPEGMGKMGMQMHRAASRFAITAQESALDQDLPRALGGLSEVMQQCNACHASYRIH